MENTIFDLTEISNIESPFTELFALLKRYENSSVGTPLLDYESEELKLIYLHIENGITILLQGLQKVGHLMGSASALEQQQSEDLNQLGYFIAAITNLTEALSDLRSDADYVLKERGAVSYMP